MGGTSSQDASLAVKGAANQAAAQRSGAGGPVRHLASSLDERNPGHHSHHDRYNAACHVPLPHYDGPRWHAIRQVLDPVRRAARQQHDPSAFVLPSTPAQLARLFAELYPAHAATLDPSAPMLAVAAPATAPSPGSGVMGAAPAALSSSARRTPSLTPSRSGRRPSLSSAGPAAPATGEPTSLACLMAALQQRSETQRTVFFRHTLPAIIDLVLQCDGNLFPYPIPYLRAGSDSIATSLTRPQVASLLACAFFCLHPGPDAGMCDHAHLDLRHIYSRHGT